MFAFQSLQKSIHSQIFFRMLVFSLWFYHSFLWNRSIKLSNKTTVSFLHRPKKWRTSGFKLNIDRNVKLSDVPTILFCCHFQQNIKFRAILLTRLFHFLMETKLCLLVLLVYLSMSDVLVVTTQPAITCSKSTIEQGVKYVQSQQ